ncbi:MAG: diaminopimelate epimerase [Schwartzia sp.]|nr:diaminopimelate epimerase [Schwartzia sp. (in: firmicutes)]
MELRFVKASPCRNTTVFVEDVVPPVARAEVARLAMGAEVLAAEQVGFLVPPLSADSALRVEMAGGEFCGNASLALGALAVARGLREPEAPFLVECSGAEHPLRVSVSPVSAGRWRGKIALSPEAKISEAELSAAGAAYRGAVVELPGICHFCVEAGPFSAETYDALLEALMARVSAEAYGVVPYRAEAGGGFSIRPYVAVPAAKSRVFEQACGSGSLALGQWLSRSQGLSRLDVSQPGGTIRVEMGEQPSISEEVWFPCAGTFFVDDSVVRGAPGAKV